VDVPKATDHGRSKAKSMMDLRDFMDGRGKSSRSEFRVYAGPTLLGAFNRIGYE
jgi:hypothetical protein